MVRIEHTLAGRDDLTAIEVQDAEFSFAPPGRIGYDEDDVDTFLDLVVVTLERSPAPVLRRAPAPLPASLPPVRPRPGVGARPLTARDVRTVGFGKPPRGRRGYQESQVDKFLDRIENTLLGQDDLTAQEIREVRFSRPMIGRRGYDESEVDAFLARAEKQLGAGPRHPGPIPPITSWKQLRQVEIPAAGPTRRGYRTSQVDRVLEEVGIALDGMIGASSTEVAGTTFALSLVDGQGYDCAFVDELMPLLAAELRRRGR
ncbi:DivIVA domain-containing protein [Actinosynnema sp. NPDC050436]|uniref:DivIVA domain-containing protein n=1 Tax=Actinosynnema sp. NPDC050436 TaxID=3155659 RepID=UPI0033F621BF